MELTIYALQEGFLPYVEQHPNFLRHLDELAPHQQEKLIQVMNEDIIKERAMQYFDNDSIYIENHILHYENELRGITYRMQINSNHIILFEQEQNPFLPFLKRIFRRFIASSSQEV